MLCTSCQADVPENSLFCPKCGERLGEGGAGTAGQAVGATIRAGDSPAQTSQPSAAEKFKQQTAGVQDDPDDDREIDLWSGGYSPKAMIPSYVAGAVVSVLVIVGVIFMWGSVPYLGTMAAVLVIGLWTWLLGVLAYRRMALRYHLTSQRFIHEQGVLSRTTDRIEVIDIDDVSFKQSLIERMIGVGSVRIESGDRTHPELQLKGIDDVKRVYDLIDGARRKERVRRGIHIASAGSSGGL